MKEPSNNLITDEQIIDLVLNHLPTSEYEHITQLAITNTDLSKRISDWDTLLFSLNNSTKEITPENHVWDNIEQRIESSKKLNSKAIIDETQQSVRPVTKAQTTIKSKLSFINKYLNSPTSWIKLGLPSIIFTAIVWVTISTLIAPSYNANAYGPSGQLVWEIDANPNEITFKSIKNISIKDHKCIAWIQTKNGWIKLGTIPDTGNDQEKTMIISKQNAIDLGDKLMITMVGQHFNANKIPSNIDKSIVAILQ